MKSIIKDEIIKRQKLESRAIIDRIIESNDSKIVIVAGAGTGKTFIFNQILKHHPGSNTMVLTFLNLLKQDMLKSIEDNAQVKTLHQYCIGILYSKLGEIELYSKPSCLIRSDAIYFERTPIDYSAGMRTLNIGKDDIEFFETRCRFYQATNFEYPVFYVYRGLSNKELSINSFDRLFVDEYQDFNLLEVSLINKLEYFGKVIIVSDDDQAIYEKRDSSPLYLRHLYSRSDFKKFELPYCFRCTKVIIGAVKDIIIQAKAEGHLHNRIAKRYDYYIDKKEVDSQRNPHIITAQFKLASSLPKFILREMSSIPVTDVLESWDDSYPTVLIVGSSHYLELIYKEIHALPNVDWKKTKEDKSIISDAYEYLLKDFNSNLGWRILMELELQRGIARNVLINCPDGLLSKNLPKDFVKKHLYITKLIQKIDADNVDPSILHQLRQSLREKDYVCVVDRFVNSIAPLSEDKTKLSIKLLTYMGCKGLSAGYVFIVGFNNKVILKNKHLISDVEICKFIVALTRTRKKCYILTDKYFSTPKRKDGTWIQAQEKSDLLKWIDSSRLLDMGVISASDMH